MIFPRQHGKVTLSVPSDAICAALIDVDALVCVEDAAVVRKVDGKRFALLLAVDSAVLATPLFGDVEFGRGHDFPGIVDLVVAKTGCPTMGIVIT